ncbi:hypothetical protein DITRI_Ditri05aG0064300 [Diplodiscus trichospermus]
MYLLGEQYVVFFRYESENWSEYDKRISPNTTSHLSFPDQVCWQSLECFKPGTNASYGLYDARANNRNTGLILHSDRQ